MFGLWAAARPWNPIPLNSRRTVVVLAGQFIALRNSQVIVWWVSWTTFFNTQRSLSVIKCGLPSQGFVVVVPSCFHFTITSPTIDLGNLRRVTMSLTNFLLMWQPITSPRLKSLSSPHLPMLLVLLNNEQHTAFSLLLYWLSSVVVTSRLQLTTTEGCPDPFDDEIVYVYDTVIVVSNMLTNKSFWRWSSTDSNM
jgi:hypothetical protein